MQKRKSVQSANPGEHEVWVTSSPVPEDSGGFDGFVAAEHFIFSLKGSFSSSTANQLKFVLKDPARTKINGTGLGLANIYHKNMGKIILNKLLLCCQIMQVGVTKRLH